MVEEAIQEGKALRAIDSLKSDLAVFLGSSPVGPLYEPIHVKRWGQFVVKFGSFKKAGHVAWAVSGFLQNGGRECYVVNIEDLPKIEDPPARLNEEEASEEAIKEWEIKLAEWEAMRAEAVEEISEKVEKGLEAIGDLWDAVGMVAVPGVAEPEVHEIVTSYSAESGCVSILDAPEKVDNIGVEGLPEMEDDQSILYFPWIHSKDLSIGRDSVCIPPSGHIAGLFVSLHDESLKPSSAHIKGALGLKYKLSANDRATVKNKGLNPLVYIAGLPAIVLTD